MFGSNRTPLTRWALPALVALAIAPFEQALAEPDSEPFEKYAKDIALDYLAEISERRRLNTFFKNEQSPFYGVQLGYTNVREGNLTFLIRDLVRLDRIPIVFGRVYDSRIVNGDFGPGWKLTLAERIYNDGDTIIYEDASNSSYELLRDGSRLASRYPHLTGISRGQIDGDRIRLQHLGLIKKFRKHGSEYRIVEVQDAYGNAIAMEYGHGRISKVTSQNGRYVSIHRDESGRIIGAEDDVGRQVRFEYENGLLVRSYGLGNNEWHYTYSGNRLSGVTDPRGAESLVATYAAGKISTV